MTKTEMMFLLSRTNKNSHQKQQPNFFSPLAFFLVFAGTLILATTTFNGGKQLFAEARPSPSAYVITTADGSDAELAVDAVPINDDAALSFQRGGGRRVVGAGGDFSAQQFQDEHSVKEEIDALVGSMKRLCSRREELLPLVGGAGAHRRRRVGAIVAADKLIERLCTSEFRRR